MNARIQEFVDGKMQAAQERWVEWIDANPHATPEEAADELFAILMGKRDQ